MALYNPLAAPPSEADEAPQEQPQQQAQPQEQQFQPEWDFKKTRDVIKYYGQVPHTFSEEDKEKIRQHAGYHNVPFYEGEFDLMDALQQAMGGFVEGFTTLKIVDYPDNEYESIIRNIAHLAGFAPGILAGPAKLLGASQSAISSIQALNKASVPMAAANFVQGKAKKIIDPVLKTALNRRGEASGAVSNFLLGNRARHVIEGAFHLGTASAVSAWQGGVDQMMEAFIGGAQAGAVFRGIGNMMGTDPGKGGQVVKALSGSLFMGLPATMRGATSAEQIYEYLLGAYFGGKEMPYTIAGALKLTTRMREYAKDHPEFAVRMDPELLPEWQKGEIAPEIKPVLKRISREGYGDWPGFGDPEENGMNYYFANKFNQGDRIDPLPIEIEGFKVTKEYVDGEPVYRLDKKDLGKWKNYGVSGGDGEINQLFAREGAKYGIPFIHYTTAKSQKDIKNTPGYLKPLSDAELGQANLAMTEANKSLDRPLSNQGKDALDLIRKNYFNVIKTDSLYVVGDLINGKKEIAGAGGWTTQMGIDANKRVNVYDQLSKRWYEYNNQADRFVEIATPKKPTRRFAAFGQGRLTSDGKNAIKELYNTHFKPTKGTKVPKTANRFSKEDEFRLKEIQDEYDVIDRTKKAFNDKLLQNPGAAEVERIRQAMEELSEKEHRLSIEEATIRQEGDQDIINNKGQRVEPEPRVEEDNDIGMTADIDIRKRSLVFANNHMESVWGTEAEPVQIIKKAETALKVEEILKPFIRQGSTTNLSDRAIKALKKEFKELDLDREGKDAVRTWLTRLNQDKPVQMLGANLSGEVIFLDKGDAARSQAGNRKNLMDPEKIIEVVAEAAGIKKDEVYAVLDHISTREHGNWTDKDLVRIREDFKRKHRDPKKALKEYHKLISKYMETMDSRDYYAFGGRGDADKIFFVKYHPKADGSYLKEVRKDNFFKGFYQTAETDFVSQYPMPNAKAIFARSFESNLLYDVSMNGLEFANPVEFKAALKRINQEGFIGSSKAWNKRSQIWWTNSYKGDPVSIAKRVNDLTEEGNYNYEIIEDLPPEIRKLYEKDKKHGQYLDTPNNQTEEHRDGAIIVRDDVLQAILKDAGQYTHKDWQKTGGQNKSFIVNPSNKKGALLGKYMMHSAGKAESARMKEKGLHMQIMDTAAKQRGEREYGTMYGDLKPENVRYNYSVKQDLHMIDPQKVPKQLLGALLEHTWMPSERKMIEETFKELIADKFSGNETWNRKLDDYLQLVAEPGFSEVRKEIKLKELMNNIDKIGIHRLTDAMKMPNNDKMVNAIWRHILKVNTDMISDAQASGEEKKVSQPMKELAEFDTVADNIIRRMEERVSAMKAKGINVDSTIAYNHTYVNHYRQQAVRNWVVDVATRPKVKNSGVGRMRPYDLAMQRGEEDKYNKYLKELNNRDDIFFLDEAYRDKDLKTGIAGIGDITLGKLWDRYYGLEFESNPSKKAEVEEVFRSAVVRVPMDSTSGTQVLKFRGFTNRSGFGILMHGRSMRSLGGADLDGDEAFFYMGGQGGFKKNLKDHFRRNKEEFYKYTDGKNEIGHKEYAKLGPDQQKRWRGYIGDSKKSKIIKEIEGFKPGNTYSRLLAHQPTENVKKRMDSMAWKYSPSQRLRMSEFSVDGRDMIDLAVSNKQLIQTVYNSIMANKANPGVDEFETDYIFRDKFGREVKKQRIKVTVYAKTDPKWLQQANELGRAQINLAADPMDQFGLKNPELWFRSLYNSYFNIGNVKVYAGQTKAGVDKWVKSAKIKPGMLDMNHLKNGVFGNITNMNKAFYGRNWGADRKYNMGEIREMAAQYMDLGIEQRNSFLPKIAEMLYPIDFSDSALQRTNIEAVKNLYKEAMDILPEYDWLKDNDIISRTTFKVPRNIIIDKVLPGPKGKVSTNKKGVKYGYNLHDYEVFDRTAKYLTDFLDVIKGTHFAKYENIIKKARDKKTGLAYRRAILREMVDQANDFFMNDLTDMATIKLINEIAKTMNPEELYKIGEIHKEVEYLKKNSYLMKKELSKLIEYGYKLSEGSTMSPQVKLMVDIVKEEYGIDLSQQKGQRPTASTAELNQMKIDARIKRFKAGRSVKENKIFDMLMLGTLNRGKLNKIDLTSKKIDKWDKLTVDFMSELYKSAARTSMSQLGFNSNEVSPNNLRKFMGELSSVFDVAKTRVNNEEAKEWTDLTSKDKKINQEVWDNEHQQFIDDKITGFEGLKEGPVSAEMKKVASEIASNLTYYGPKVKNHISELVRGLFQKDFNTMNKEDWVNFNNWLKIQKAGTLWQRLFDKKGEFKLHWRHHYMFPAAISREMIAYDMKLLHERGYFTTSDGRMVEGKVARPTSYIDKVQSFLGKMNAQAEDTTEELVNDLQKKMLFINSFEDGEVLRQIAVGRKNAREADVIASDTNTSMSNSQRFQRADEYRNVYKDLNKLHNYEEVLSKKEYHLNIDGKRRRYTGEEVVDHIDKTYTEIFENAYKLVDGEKGAMKPFIVDYYDPQTKLSPIIDTVKFMTHLEMANANGLDISKKFGVNGLRMVARQLKLDMIPNIPKYAKLKEELRLKPFEKIGQRTAENYWPHMMFNAKKANKALVAAARAIQNDTTMSEEVRTKELTKLVHKHKNLTGDWGWADIASWEMFDRVMGDIAAKKKTSEHVLKWFNGDQRTGNLNRRSSHVGGWSVDSNVPEMYLKGIADTYFKNLSQIYSRSIIHDKMYNSESFNKKYGKEQTEAWVKFMKLFANDAMGHPTVIPDAYRQDKNLKIKGTLYDWWSDDKVADRLTSMKKKIFGDKNVLKLPEELRKYNVDLQQVRELSNLEAQFEMAALLAHPKTVVGNIFGGTGHTIQSVGWRNFRDSVSSKYLASINPEWANPDKVYQFVTAAGIMPEQMMYEFGLTKAAASVKNKQFMEAASKKIFRDPEMAEETLTNLAKKYGVVDKVRNFAAKWMTIPERKLRRDAFMAHYVQWYKKLGGAVKRHDHPFLIEMAKKGVKATQFLYSAPYRPAFARTALGKVMTRFMLWSWNAVRFRNDVYRQAKVYGFKPGTEDFDRFVRTTQIDMFIFALGNIFAYSLFDTGMPAPYTWFEDTAQWMFGDEEERDKSFFGTWPTAIAPLAIVTPPIARIPMSVFKSLADDEYRRLSEYYAYTMFPFGRLARDFSPLVPGNLVENPTRVIEKWAGLPARDLQKSVKEWKEGNKPRKPTPGGLYNPLKDR